MWLFTPSVQFRLDVCCCYYFAVISVSVHITFFFRALLLFYWFPQSSSAQASSRWRTGFTTKPGWRSWKTLSQLLNSHVWKSGAVREMKITVGGEMRLWKTDYRAEHEIRHWGCVNACSCTLFSTIVCTRKRCDRRQGGLRSRQQVAATSSLLKTHRSGSFWGDSQEHGQAINKANHMWHINFNKKAAAGAPEPHWCRKSLPQGL